MVLYVEIDIFSCFLNTRKEFRVTNNRDNYESEAAECAQHSYIFSDFR